MEGANRGFHPDYQHESADQAGDQKARERVRERFGRIRSPQPPFVSLAPSAISGPRRARGKRNANFVHRLPKEADSCADARSGRALIVVTEDSEGALQFIQAVQMIS